MNINKLLSFLVLLVIFLVPLCDAGAKQIKGGVAVSTVKKGGKPTRAMLNANPMYKEAVAFFQKKNYAGALTCFQSLDSNGFCCDMVHYYIGQCYQNTNQTVAAQQHYDWVVEKTKDPTLRSYADYANQTIAYYSNHRTYAGQGNNFDRGSRGGGGGGGRRVGFG